MKEAKNIINRHTMDDFDKFVKIVSDTLDIHPDPISSKDVTIGELTMGELYIIAEKFKKII